MYEVIQLKATQDEQKQRRFIDNKLMENERNFTEQRQTTIQKRKPPDQQEVVQG